MRRLVAAVVAIAASLALSACSDPPDDRQVEIDGATSSPTPEPTVSRDPDALLTYAAPKPERPKDEFTKASAVAFVEYAFQQLDYAYGVPDVQAFRSIIDPALCRGCKTFLDNLTTLEANDRVIVSAQRMTTSGSKVVNVDGDFATIRTKLVLPRAMIVETADDSKKEDDLSGRAYTAVVNVRWVDDKWQLIDTQKEGS